MGNADKVVIIIDILPAEPIARPLLRTELSTEQASQWSIYIIRPRILVLLIIRRRTSKPVRVIKTGIPVLLNLLHLFLHLSDFFLELISLPYFPFNLLLVLIFEQLLSLDQIVLFHFKLFLKLVLVHDVVL